MSDSQRSASASHGPDDHTDSLAYYNGREALDMAHYMDAANNFTLLIERHPKDPQYRWMRAKAYYGLQAWTLCRQDCDRARELGMAISAIDQLTEMATAEELKNADAEPAANKMDLMALVALRHNYRLRSLFISADRRLAEGDYNGVLDLVALAERLLDTGDSSGELAFNLGLIRVKACAGAGNTREALEVIDFYVKLAQAAMRDDYVSQFKALRTLLY